MIKVVYYFALLLTLFSCHTSSGIMGKYVGGADDWKYKLHLNQDSSFYMTYNGHLSLDTAFGNFSLKRDTILFSYHYSKDDSASAMELVNNFNRPLDSALLFEKSGIRPLIAIVKANGLNYNGFKLKKKLRP
ncbi:MAG: hypothetical protein ACO1NX_03870 [Chitinophagaceae bacterium]